MGLLLMIGTIIPVWIAMVQIRPFKLSRILLTYLLPVIPFVVTFDGMVSCLRTYSPSELLNLVNEPEFSGFQWKAGLVRKGAAAGFPVTCLIGLPIKQTGL